MFYFRLFLAIQLASRTALLPTPNATMTSQQAIEDSALLRALRMNALNVCFSHLFLFFCSILTFDVFFFSV